MIHTRVSLSSGEFFYVDAEPDALVDRLNNKGIVSVGGRFVNPAQVAQITREEMSTIHTPERLEAADGAVS